MHFLAIIIALLPTVVLCAPCSFEIDIVPDDDNNTLPCRENAHVPVAILSNANFDPLSLSVNDITLQGGSAASEKLVHKIDVNGDGVKDLLLHFRLNDTQMWPSCYAKRATLLVSGLCRSTKHVNWANL